MVRPLDLVLMDIVIAYGPGSHLGAWTLHVSVKGLEVLRVKVTASFTSRRTRVVCPGGNPAALNPSYASDGG